MERGQSLELLRPVVTYYYDLLEAIDMSFICYLTRMQRPCVRCIVLLDDRSDLLEQGRLLNQRRCKIP